MITQLSPYAALFICYAFKLNGYMLGIADGMSIESSRREMLGRTAASTFGIVSSPGWAVPGTAAAEDTHTVAAPNSPSFSSYQIFPDSSPKLDPTLQKISQSDLTGILAMTGTKNGEGYGGALWLGEHHNSVKDHQLQADFVRRIHEQRRKKLGDTNGNMAVGLEMVQMQFQPVLDAYIAKKISAEEMKDQVEWQKRWSWSFDGEML